MDYEILKSGDKRQQLIRESFEKGIHFIENGIKWHVVWLSYTPTWDIVEFRYKLEADHD